MRRITLGLLLRGSRDTKLRVKLPQFIALLYNFLLGLNLLQELVVVKIKVLEGVREFNILSGLLLLLLVIFEIDMQNLVDLLFLLSDCAVGFLDLFKVNFLLALGAFNLLSGEPLSQAVEVVDVFAAEHFALFHLLQANRTNIVHGRRRARSPICDAI